jgi:hypothetical protein
MASRVEGVSRESPEVVQHRRLREEIDQDDAAEAVVQRRIREAEARNRPHAVADHKAFDQRIRAEEAAGPRALPRGEQLRQAMIWKEILGPPKALEE